MPTLAHRCVVSLLVSASLAAQLAPQGPTVRQILVELVGSRPVPGAEFDFEFAGLSSGQLVAFQGNGQAVLFDPAQGAFFSSQGLELLVGN